MIHLRITSFSEDIMEQVADLLLKNRLAIDMDIDRDVERLVYEKDQVISRQLYVLTASTKSLLFPRIDQMLRDQFGDDVPEIYGLAIVHMDWDQKQHLTEDLEKV